MPVALVTGASSGLGRALSVRLGREGWAVAMLARRAEELEAALAEVEEAGGRGVAIPCDVADRDAVHRAVRRAGEALGPVDLLVANAGMSGTTRPDDLDAREVERILRVNVLGAVHPLEAVLPGMLERDRGHVVAVSSLAGMNGLPLTAAYSASKAAMTAFFESLRIDLRGTGVDVTVIAPGYVRTPMTDRNDHAMPFLVDLDDATERIWRAIRDRERMAAFPAPLSWLAWVSRVFPRGLYDAMAARMRRDKREG